METTGESQCPWSSSEIPGPCSFPGEVHLTSSGHVSKKKTLPIMIKLFSVKNSVVILVHCICTDDLKILEILASWLTLFLLEPANISVFKHIYVFKKSFMLLLAEALLMSYWGSSLDNLYCWFECHHWLHLLIINLLTYYKWLKDLCYLALFFILRIFLAFFFSRIVLSDIFIIVGLVALTLFLSKCTSYLF